MKIENIIEDIKKDITELKGKLEERFKSDHPDLKFAIVLPDLEEMTTIKLIALSVEEESACYYFSVHVHTHNGNRVFENCPQKIIDKKPVPYEDRHPLQDGFVNLLREIIKKNKHKAKPDNKSNNLYNDLCLYANTA